MIAKETIGVLREAFKSWAGDYPDSIMQLPVSGSERTYFRLTAGSTSCIGAYHPNHREMESFIYLTTLFSEKGLPVPELYHVDAANEIYLLQDLGNISLFDIIDRSDDKASLAPLLKDVMDELIGFQVMASAEIDYTKCYPRSVFDRQSMQWDLNYFKYNFLKLAGIHFHEDLLEEDFRVLTDKLASAENSFFMYRDFQSRNIMVLNDRPWFIDYQGGRKGPLQYDVASFLFQVRADLPFELREELLQHYIGETEKNLRIDRGLFIRSFYDFVLLRLLQVLGAYGFRGLHQQKPHFLKSIPQVSRNISWLIENTTVLPDLPEISRALMEVIRRYPYSREEVIRQEDVLTVTVKSFSYRKSIPADLSGNGGGFIFDCRALPNPGREEKYRALSGKDRIVVDYLEQYSEVEHFLKNTLEVVMQSVRNYKERGFRHLAVNFGCTGGQHRSVYCAGWIADALSKTNGVRVDLHHTELEEHGK